MEDRALYCCSCSSEGSGGGIEAGGVGNRLFVGGEVALRLRGRFKGPRGNRGGEETL